MVYRHTYIGAFWLSMWSFEQQQQQRESQLNRSSNNNSPTSGSIQQTSQQLGSKVGYTVTSQEYPLINHEYLPINKNYQLSHVSKIASWTYLTMMCFHLVAHGWIPPSDNGTLGVGGAPWWNNWLWSIWGCPEMVYLHDWWFPHHKLAINTPTGCLIATNS